MARVNRRSFLGTTTAAAAAAVSMHVAERASAAETEPIRVAVMGVNGRGRSLISSFSTFPEVEIAYICDPDSSVIPAAVGAAVSRNGKEPRVEKDFRVALDDPEVDVLVCAAPDHWHSLATILACQAGKDVYVEKPISHNIVEGRRAVEAARKYERVVQAGTQRRSGADYQSAVKMVKSGRLGDVNFARTWITSQRPNIGHKSPTAPPEHLDLNLWAGPATDPEYQENLVHYHWHWRWNYGTGECGNNGVHGLDIARWGMGIEYPHTICCGGGKYFFTDDDQETPDTQVATFDFDGGAIQWEHRTWSDRGIDGESFGIVFYGSEATLFCESGGWKLYAGGKEIDKHAPAERELAHIQNFLECVRSRETPNADIEIAHRSTSLCHLANIAWRTRSTLEYDGETESIRNNEAATALLGRKYREGFELPTL